MFATKDDSRIQRISRTDPNNLLSAFSAHPFELDDAHWPSAEHYYQATKFEDPALREQIRSADTPKAAQALAKKHKRKIRKDWKTIRKVMMTRGMYTKCMSHPAVAKALLDTADQQLVETSQYDYYWGCGRDGLGENTFGELLAGIRDKLRQTN